MADIKKLFEKNKIGGVLSDATIKKVGDKIESADYVASNLKEKNRFVPYINFESASNFARYGSAQKYYQDAIGHIINEYPYDGSLRERIDWRLSASYLDLHMFDSEYPRTNGYILIGKTYGTAVTDAGGYDTFSAAQQEYIFVKGSPHPSTGSGDLRTDWKEYNLYNTSSLGKYNLEIDGNNGITLEFWLNKEGYSSANESSKEVIFDLWNSGTYGNNDYGRFRVELTGGATSNVLDPVFNIELRSGSAGFSYRNDIIGPHSTTVSLSSSTPFTGSWNHFALSFKNDGTQMKGQLFRNGVLEHTLLTGSNIGSVTGSMIATVGSLVTNVSGTFGAKSAAKLSASLDDFRYWRRSRSTEQVKSYWFTDVGGGTNSDIENAATASTKYSYENPLDLGLYYKFNEGILNTTQTKPQDSIILDYSGRTTNGSWVGYAVGSRFTGSAMVLSNAAKKEFKDPIIYANHPDVVSLSNTKGEEGFAYDQQNNASIYNSFPSWIIEEDESNNGNVLKDLTQIMGSYFDTLQLQIEAVPKIKDVMYPSGSYKPYPFANRLVDNLGLVSSEVFENANALEYLASRDDHRNFNEKLNETKNLIYQNIYNNLIYIFKSKGTEKSFRNLIRCYGIDDELVKLNLYGNDITYGLLNNGNNRIVKKNYVDFHKSTRFNATVFQQTSSTNANSREYVSSSNEVTFRGNTYEAEAIFPKPLNRASRNYVENDFLVSSLYGCHTLGTSNNWASSDVGNFQVAAVKPKVGSSDAYFQLTGTAGGYFPLLTSSLFTNVYNDSKWNFAVKIKPIKYPLADGVSGSAVGNYDLEFCGYNYTSDILQNSFEVNTTMSSDGAAKFLTANKKFFAGAHRTNFDGGILQQADTRISSVRVWMDYLKNETIQAHAKDVENFGSEYPYKNAYISQLSKSLGDQFVQIPQMETLVLDWNFDTLTGSNPSGEFIVQDFSSGSTALTTRWGWLGPIAKYQHTGVGYDFPVNDTGSISRVSLNSFKQQLPETLNSSDMVSIIDDTTRQIFSRESRPIDYYFAFEKSMYGIISEQMINYFGTIIAFNNLIGEPVNKYRQNYKDMEKLRALYFERVDNTPDFEKFVQYFKWIDTSLGTMLIQLAPASADFSEKLRNVVESHVLERNKYWTKFPTLDSKATPPEAGLRGITELTYPWARGSAPVSNLQKDNCFWWNERTKRQNPVITSGDANVDSDRDKVRLANDFRSGSGPNLAVSRDSTSTTTTYEGQAYAIRNFTKPYRLVVDEVPEINGGSNFPKNKKIEYAHESLKLDSDEQLSISLSSIISEKDCADQLEPNPKVKKHATVVNSKNTEGYTSGKTNIFAPFSMYSSSVINGYLPLSDDIINVEINNYHDDVYGDDNGIPAQSPFTEAHVGGRQHRHINVNFNATDTKLTRAEAWNLDVTTEININSRTVTQPRATMIRDAYAKRPLNIANIKWGTSSATVGNYQHDYQMLQTSGRKINNRYFVDSEGFVPAVNLVTASSTYISGTTDLAMPRRDLTGSNKFIFVEKFSAPGGPEVSRGSLDFESEEFGVYNNLNYRNLIVRQSLDSWYKKHTGQFGIYSVSGGITGYKQPIPQSYDTLANYHKVNKNAGSPYLIKSGYDREAEWMISDNLKKADFDTTIYKNTPSWGEGAWSNQKIPINGYIEFAAYANTGYLILGLNESPPATISGSSHLNVITDIEFAIGLRPVPDGVGNVAIWESGVNVANFTSVSYVANDRFRIVRDKNRIFYQHLTGSDKDFVTFYTSLSSSYQDLYPDAQVYGIVGSTNPYGFKNARISNPQYDNWYVQHAIPQSELQYSWINSSYDSTKEQPFGYASNYSAPSASTSTTASSVQFIPSADLLIGHPDTGVTSRVTASFNGLFTIVAGQFANYEHTYVNDFSSSINTIQPGSSFRNTAVARDISYYFLNLNGPYQYPSWKQIRTGETPIGRYNARNNILSVMESPRIVELSNPIGTGQTGPHLVSNSNNIKNFIEPPVTFKYRPLQTVNISDDNSFTLRHTYGNNMCLFSQGPSNDGTSESGSIYNFLNIDSTKNEKQTYDYMTEDADLFETIDSVRYKEIIYPRGTNTGLAQTRGRTNYAEVANGTLNADGTISASISNGNNGIDRGPLERRTFWRNQDKYRNRRSGIAQGGAASGIVKLGGAEDDSRWYTISGALPNSQGYYDGFATSIYGLGKTPIVAEHDWLYRPSGLAANRWAFTNYRISGGVSINNFTDMGELNSANGWTWEGWAGTNVSGNVAIGTLQYTSVHYPTASTYYYHFPALSPGQFSASQYPISPTQHTASQQANRPLEWRAPELSGKKPFFDSYEEYAEDIRGVGKNLTVVPEFKISEQMPYYLKNNFRAQNDKILSLPGGNITASANSEEGSSPTLGGGFSISSGVRVFDEKFFNDYSNSDFQKYFGKFDGYREESAEITLRCNGIKKLLPYNGFYPQQRSLQLASLFSQSIAPHINGIGWDQGVSDGSPSSEHSGALALQSLLQPYYAPGIMYNTIKSGISVDWGALTGSSNDVFTQATSGPILNGAISASLNYRVPFESIMDPLDNIGLPISSSTASKMFLLAPTWQKISRGPFYAGKQTYPYQEPRKPWTSIDRTKRVTAKTTKEYGLYKAATNNFFAEIPNFFLQENKLSTIYSKEQLEVGNALEAGKDYYMDITLEKTPELVMMQEDNRDILIPLTGAVLNGKSFRDVPFYDGRLFGPPVLAGDPDVWGKTEFKNGDSTPTARVSAPAYAPYTPPYFYGKSVMTLKFSANASNTLENFTWSKYFNEVSMSFSNERMDAMFNSIAGTDYASNPSPAKQSVMEITSSVKWNGLAIQREVDRNEAGKVVLIKSQNTNESKWVISPFMETPVLDFSSNSYPPNTGPRGMWGGYGATPEDAKGIILSVEQSTSDIQFNEEQNKDFAALAFPDTNARSQNIGQVNTSGKDISEAIVAIPYIKRKSENEEAFTTEKPFLDDRYFFSLKAQPFENYELDALEVYDLIKESLDGSDGRLAATEDVAANQFFGLWQDKYLGETVRAVPTNESSVARMINKMDDYVIPPELDFNTYNSGNDRIEPFAMYIMEFKHTLSQQDLSDIWQGLMPKISTTAELESVAESHKRLPIIEFFGNRKLPDDIRWMVFKVKKKANNDYFKLTADTTDDEKFAQDFFTTKNGEVPYSYNWPYDYFSLVELAELEVEKKNKK